MIVVRLQLGYCYIDVSRTCPNGNWIFIHDTDVQGRPMHCALDRRGLGAALRETGKNLLLIPEDKDRMPTST